MKKLLSLLLCVILTLALFACGEPENPSEPASSEPSSEDIMGGGLTFTEPLRLAGLKGPTSLGMLKIMEDDADGVAKNEYVFTLAGSADEITPKLIKGELDIAAVPSNLASVLYNKTNGQIKLLAVNTYGVLYIVGKNVEINDIKDLSGKTVYATGKGSTPEYTLTHILNENGITDVNVEYKSEPAEIVALLSKNESGIAILPQPYVTVAMSKVENLKVLFDLDSEWEKVEGSGIRIVTGTLVVRAEYAETHKQDLYEFLEEYAESVKFVNENPAEAAKISEKFGIFAADIAEKAIPECNITLITGENMKLPVNKYLGVLYEQNAASVGGTLPKDDFFFILG